MQGNKTHEQQVKILERKDDGHRKDANQSEAVGAFGSGTPRTVNQESRDHNKHNNPGQSGHGPQKHNPAEEKQS